MTEEPNGHVATPDALDFAPGNETRIWSQVVDQIHDMLRTHVRGITRVAISGPNELDLVFPRSYHFAKQYCEQPAQTNRLEMLLRQTTGRPVRIRFHLAEDGSVPEPKGMAAAPSRRRVPETIDDTFVQSVMNVFGATVVRVDSAGGGSVPESSPEGSADV